MLFYVLDMTLLQKLCKCCVSGEIMRYSVRFDCVDMSFLIKYEPEQIKNFVFMRVKVMNVA